MGHQDKIRRNLQTVGVALDSQYTVFGIKIGWDGIIGLIPVFGDLATTLISVYIILSASQLGLPFSVLGRMALNVILDNVIGGIPVLGWVFDFFYRSNLKNLALVEQYQENPALVRSRSRLLLGTLLVGTIVISTALIVALAWLLMTLGDWIIHAIR